VGPQHIEGYFAADQTADEPNSPVSGRAIPI
jgi:hypothetical protein